MLTRFRLLSIIGVAAVAGIIATAIVLYYSLMPAWVSVEVSGEVSHYQNGNLVVVREGFVDEIENAGGSIVTITDSELEQFPVLQSQIERADEIYPAVPTGFDKLPSQSQARAIIELLQIDNGQGGTDRGHFVYNDRVYHIHIIYRYEQPASA